MNDNFLIGHLNPSFTFCVTHFIPQFWVFVILSPSGEYLLPPNKNPLLVYWPLLNHAKKIQVPINNSSSTYDSSYIEEHQLSNFTTIYDTLVFYPHTLYSKYSLFCSVMLLLSTFFSFTMVSLLSGEYLLSYFVKPSCYPSLSLVTLIIHL